jgi:TnpA family transposase
MQVAACHGQADDTGLAIEEHYTDTGGVTDHVCGLCHLFGFRFAPRIRDIKERKLYLGSLHESALTVRHLEHCQNSGRQ